MKDSILLTEMKLKAWTGVTHDVRDLYEDFTRCGLNFRAVEADTGAIGGNGSHEFTALAENGESCIVYCEKCDMAATDERAECADAEPSGESELPMEEVRTPGTKTIEAVAEYLGLQLKDDQKLCSMRLLTMIINVTGYVVKFLGSDRKANMIQIVITLEFRHAPSLCPMQAKHGEMTGCVG